MQQSSSREADMSLASQEVPPYFVENGGLLPHSPPLKLSLSWAKWKQTKKNKIQFTS